MKPRSSVRGVAAIEFALVLPLLLLLVAGVIEVTRYVIMNQKVDNASATIGSVLSNGFVHPSDALLAKFETKALKELLGSYHNSTARLSAIFVRRDQNDVNYVSFSYPAGATPPDLKQINVNDTETVIVTSVDLQYQPLIPGFDIPGFTSTLASDGNMVRRTSYYPARQNIFASMPADPKPPTGFPDPPWDPLESTCRHASLSIL